MNESTSIYSGVLVKCFLNPTQPVGDSDTVIGVVIESLPSVSSVDIDELMCLWKVMTPRGIITMPAKYISCV